MYRIHSSLLSRIHMEVALQQYSSAATSRVISATVFNQIQPTLLIEYCSRLMHCLHSKSLYISRAVIHFYFYETPLGDLSAFYLPCKIWGSNFSMLKKLFIRVKFYLCSLPIIFSMLQKCILCSFDWNCSLVFVQKIPKNANCEDFLTKFVYINNHTHHFLHMVVILQEAKNYSQHEEIFTT